MDIQKLEKIKLGRTFLGIVESKGNTKFDQNAGIFMKLLDMYPQEFLARSGLPSLIRLCLHNVWISEVELYSAYQAARKFKTVKFGSSLENFKIVYGPDGGLVVYEQFKRKHADKMVDKRGDSHLRSLGYTDEEIYFKRQETSKKIWDTRHTAAEESNDPLFFAKQSLASIHYEGDSDVSREEFINKTLAKGRTPEACAKAQQTKRRKFESGEYDTIRGRVGSKVAKIFLDPISREIQDLGLKFYWGYDDIGERWVRNETTKEIFFIDFCVPEINLAIEFHGTAYHPKSEDDPKYSPPGFVKLKTAKDKWEYDKRKELTIVESGYTLFVVFEDDDHTDHRNKILKWIESNVCKI